MIQCKENKGMIEQQCHYSSNQSRHRAIIGRINCTLLA